MILRRGLWTGTSGMSLIELIVSIGISSGVILGVSTSMNYAMKGYKTMQNRQDASSFNTLIRSTANNPKTCPTFLAPTTGTYDPSSLSSPLPSLLKTPIGTFTPPPAGSTVGSKVGSTGNFTVNSITYKKVSDGYQSGANHSFSLGGKEYWPVIGEVAIELNNDAVKKKFAFGTPTQIYKFPLNMTFERTGTGAWSVKSCVSESTVPPTNAGWDASSLTDPNQCTTTTLTSNAGSSAVCPDGTYVVKQTSVNTPYQVTAYQAVCSCAGSCKGCHCIAGSDCSNSCDSNGHSYNVHAACNGTCDRHDYCQPYQSTQLRTTVTTTCCKVKRQ